MRFFLIAGVIRDKAIQLEQMTLKKYLDYSGYHQKPNSIVYKSEQ